MGETAMERLLRRSKDYVGCSNGTCVFGHPGGMHTNGGCHCLDELRELYGVDPDSMYSRVRKGLLRLNRLLAQAEEGSHGR